MKSPTIQITAAMVMLYRIMSIHKEVTIIFYDYNSVYTGDTSNFLPIDNCDIVDVPDGINLQSSIADSNKRNYNFDQSTATLGPEQTTNNVTSQLEAQNNKNIDTGNDDSFSSDDQYGLSSNTDDDEFIEDSNYQSSDDEEGNTRLNKGNIEPAADYNGPGLRRTISLGKSTDSLKNLSNVAITAPSANGSHNFVTGERKEGQDLNNGLNNARISGRPLLSQRSSNRSFIFNSNSDDSDDSDDSEDSEVGKPLVKSPLLTSHAVLSTKKTTNHKLTPPSRTPSSSFLSNSSDPNK